MRALVILVLLSACAPSARTLPQSPGSSLGGQSASSSATAAPVVPPASREATAPSTSARPASPLIAQLELFDAHIHYSQDAWASYSPERVIEILRRAGVRRALVSSTPDAGTQRLYELAPELLVPILRPYRSRDDIRILGIDDELTGGDVVPGFTIRVRELFPA